MAKTGYSEIIDHVLTLLSIGDNVAIGRCKVATANNSDAFYNIYTQDSNLILKLYNNVRGAGIKDNYDKTINYIRGHFKALENNINLPILSGEFDEVIFEVSKFIDGDSLFEVIRKYLEDKIDSAYPKECFLKLGKTIAKIHYAGVQDKETTDLAQLKTSLIHKDLHGDNIFYTKKGEIILIDNDGFASSIENPTFVSEDLCKLFLQGLNIFMLFIVDAEFDKNSRTEYTKIVKSFFDGYSSSLSDIDCIPYLANVLQDTVNLFYQQNSTEELLPISETGAIISEILGCSLEMTDF